MEKIPEINSRLEAIQNGYLDSRKSNRTEQSSDQFRPLLFFDTSLGCTSRKSSVDSLILDSDWSDTSFYTLPSIKKIPLPSRTIGEPSHVDINTGNPSRERNSCIFSNGLQQQNVPLAKSQHLLQRHNYNRPKRPAPRHIQVPLKAMDRSSTDYSDSHASPDSDDTIGRSSSGIASDIESPRSYQSSFVETRRGLARSYQQEIHQEPVGARSLGPVRSRAREPQFSHSFHNVQSNVGLGMCTETWIPHGRRTQINNTGIPPRNTASYKTFQSNIDIQPTRNLNLNTGTPKENLSDSRLPQTNIGIPLDGSFYDSTGIPRHIFPSDTLPYSDSGIPAIIASSHRNPNIPSYSKIPPRIGRKGDPLVNMSSDTEILKHFDKLSTKNVNVKDRTSNMVLNNSIRSSDFDTWESRKILGIDNSCEWKHISLLNSFAVEPPQHVSSSVWAMKLLQTETAPTANPEVLLKARLFRRWHQRARLQRLDRIECENKMNKAVEFWRNNTIQKHFTAWKRNGLEQLSKAEQIYRRHMLETGLKGLQFAVQVSSHVSCNVRKRVGSRLVAKFWLKWQSQLAKKQSDHLRSAFNRWRVFHLAGNWDKILEGIADKHIMTKSYIKWKMRYSVEQNNSIAKLNFQIRLITRCWHSWRIYAAQRIVKTRTNEVARVHYENHLQVHTFKVWFERRKRCCVASSLLKRRIVVKAFYSWRNWTQYAKVIHQRFQSMCKEYYNRALLKQSFLKWKQRLQTQQADNYRYKLLEKRVYRLWHLRYRRNVIHRHLCKAMAKKGKKRRFFKKWQNATESQYRRRQVFIGIFHKLLLTKMMLKWKNYTNMKMSLNLRLEFSVHKKNIKATRISMRKWMFAMKVANFRKQVKINWTSRCAKNASIAWKLLLKRKALEQTLIETRPTRHLWLIKVFWNRWKKRKQAVDQENEHVNSVAAILTRNFKRRIFTAWRVTNQQQQIIAPTVSRRERKLFARVFDAWRLHTYRQKYIVDQHTRANEKLMDRHFLFWKEKAFLQIKGHNATKRLQFSKLARAFSAWRGYIREIRHERLKQRAERLQVLSLYFKKWTQIFEEQVEATEKIRGNEARNVLLTRWVFKYWQKAAESKSHHLDNIEEQVKFKIRHLKLRTYMDAWIRWYDVTDMARKHLSTRQQQLMCKVFLAWSGVIKEEINAQLNRFSTNLALDCSMGSVSASQLFRSGTLDSNGGSLLRSTLDSTLGSSLRSTMDSSLSDYLSSGYWTTRRGSGSVFPIRTPGVKQRDDDVASLPGRFDHIPGPDSPRFRSASPITLIRESNNVAQVPPPLAAGQSPITSPTPSPPELHLSLASSADLTDSVFSPVRDRGSSMSLRQEFERRQSSMDDEEILDSMSMTSGLSTASVRDKELVVIDTIRHWLHLSLSKTFRSWLKYTRQKKLLRELLYFAKEKKAQKMICRRFKMWRRKLYVTVASRQFWLNTTKLRCLKAWYAYVEHRQLREKSFNTAATINRSIILKRFFNTWRTKYAAKIRLQTFIGQWQKKAIVTGKHKAIGERIQLQHSQRDLSQKFQYWVLMTHKSQEAKQLYLGRLLPRTFIAWHHYSCTHVNNCKKSMWFKDQRVLTMAFREWKRQFEAQSMAQDLVETKEIELCIEIVKTWHNWATGVCVRRRLWRSYHKSLQMKTMKSIFNTWCGQVKRRESAEKMHKHSLMKSVLFAWKEVCHSAQENKKKTITLKANLASSVLRKTFDFWRQLLVHSQLATSRAQELDSALVEECFMEWREFTLETRAEKYHYKYMLKKMYHKWFDQCHARKKARMLIRSWRIITEDSKALNNKAMEICQLTDKKNLHQAFTHWMQATHKIQKAKHHYAVATLGSSLKAWYSYAHTKASCRKILSLVQAAKSQALLLGSFSTWKGSFERCVLNQEILDDYLHEKQLHHLMSCMVKWRKFALKGRSQKYHDERLIFKGFQEWRCRLSQKKGLQKVMEKVFYRHIHQAVMHWKQWTTRTKRQRAQADEFNIIVANNILKDCFAYWVVATENSRQAKLQHSRIVKKRVLFVWKAVINARIKERNDVEAFQKQVMRKKVGVMLKQWQTAYKKSQMYNQLMQMQLQKHNALVLHGCIKHWKKYIKKCRADKHYNIMLNARFFLEWKIKFEERLAEKDKKQVMEEKASRHYHFRLSQLCFRSWSHDVRVEKHLEMKQQLLVEKHFRLWQKKASLKSIASVRGDQQIYSKYWSKWRNQLVRKRVAELMMKHEEKKLLSEIFGAWYKMTMIERRLLNEWNLALTEKWFRRWMQKYNES